MDVTETDGDINDRNSLVAILILHDNTGYAEVESIWYISPEENGQHLRHPQV